MSLGRMMAGGRAKRERRANDWYPTPSDAVIALLVEELSAIQAHLRPGEAVWEPACGDGALARVIEAAGLPVVGSDIEPRGYGCARNFLAGKRAPLSGVIVTNPPFDRARQFVERARVLKARYLALLLKATYWHAAERLSLWASWPPAAIYPLSWRVDFTGEGQSTMDVSWCVWVSGPQRGCVYRPLPRPTPEVMARFDRSRAHAAPDDLPLFATGDAA